MPRNVIAHWHSIKRPLRGVFFGRWVCAYFLHGFNLIAAALLVASLLLPTHFPPWVSWHSEVLAFLAVFVISWQAALSQAKAGLDSRIQFPSIGLVLLLLVVITVAQGFTHQIEFAGDAFVLVLYFLLCFMALGVGYGFNPSQTPVLPTLAVALLAAAVSSALIAFIQVLNVWDNVAWVHRMPYARRPGANLGQPNLLATLLLMGFASLIYLYELGRLHRVLLAPVMGVLLCGLAIAESRTSLLSFVFIFVWWFTKRNVVKPRLGGGVWAVSSLFFGAAYLLWPSLLSRLQFVGAGAVVDTQPGLRLVVWPQLIEAILQKPWWGWGLREVSKAHNTVINTQLMTESYTYSHNLVLDLALGMGLPLTGLIVFVSAIWAWQKFCAVRETHGWYCVATLIPVGVHSMLEFPFAYAFFLAPVFILLGQLERLCSGKTLFQLNLKTALLSLGLTSLLAMALVWEYIKIEEDFRMVRFESMRIGQTPQGYVRPDVHLLTQLDALLKAGRIRPVPGMTEGDLSLARAVALRFPWPATQNRYALSLALNGQTEEAERQLRIMRAMHTEKNFSPIRENWQQLAHDTYPQLQGIAMP